MSSTIWARTTAGSGGGGDGFPGVLQPLRTSIAAVTESAERIAGLDAQALQMVRFKA